MDVVVIRAATAEDAAQVARMNLVVHQFHAEHASAYFRLPDPQQAEAALRERLAQDGLWIYLAVTAAGEETAVGYIVLTLHQREATPFNQAIRWLHVDELGVDPAWRRQGIGQRLMETAVAHARAHDIPEIQLSTWAFNARAQAFFTKLGYTPMLLRYHRRLEP